MFLLYGFISIWAEVFGYKILNQKLFAAIMATDMVIVFLYAIYKQIKYNKERLTKDEEVEDEQ